MEELHTTERTRLKRLPKRGSYDRGTINAIIDEALFCHVGFVHAGAPFVIPTLHIRIGENLYVHGSAASRMIRTASEGIPLCVTVTHIDSLILARSAFHHSVDYRSVVILGTAHEVEDATEKTQVLEALVEHIIPQRWADIRQPAPKELAATSVLCLPITEASAKVRAAGVVDDEEDYALPMWAGKIPLKLVAGEPVPDDRLTPEIAMPSYVANYRLPNARGNSNGKAG